jgi:hypothetical protein
MTTTCSWVMCATVGAAGWGCWLGLLRLVMFGGAAGAVAAISAGSRSLPAHYTGTWAAEKAAGQAAVAISPHEQQQQQHCWLMLPRLVSTTAPATTPPTPLCSPLILVTPRACGQQLPGRASLVRVPTIWACAGGRMSS